MYDITAGIPAVIAEVQPDDSVVYCIREPGGSLIARIDGEDPLLRWLAAGAGPAGPE